MGRLSLAPIPVGSVSFTVPLAGVAKTLSAVRLGNESDVTLAWQWGEQAGYLYPSEIDVFRPTSLSDQSIQLTPVTVLPPGLAVTKNLLVDLAFAPDDFPGTYPQQMARLAQTGTNRQELVGSPFTAPNGSTTMKTFTLAPQTPGVAVLIDAGGAAFPAYSLLVTGHSTGQVYFPTGQTATSPVSPFLPVVIRVDPEKDPSLDIFVTPGGNPTLNVHVVELFQPEAIEVFNQLPLQVTFATGLAAPFLRLLGTGKTPTRIALSGLTAGVANRVQLIAGVVNQTITLFAIHCTVEQAVGSNALHFCNGDPNAGGSIFDDFDTSVQAEKIMWYGGSPLTVSQGLFVYTDVTISQQIHGGIANDQF